MSAGWYDLTVEQLAKRFGTDPALGLSKEEARRRFDRRGENRIFPVPRGSFGDYIKQLATDFTSVLLIITAAIALIFEQKVSAAVLIFIVALNTVMTIVTYVKAHRVLEEIGEYSVPAAKVMRGGKMYMLKQDLIVPGDVVYLSAGDIVPADMRLIWSEQLTVLEAGLTGIPSSRRKSPSVLIAGDLKAEDQSNMLFATTVVTGGICRGIVCATGEDTLVCRRGKTKPVVTHENLRVMGVLRRHCRTWSLTMIALIFVLMIVDLLVGLRQRGLFDCFLTALTLAVASMSELYTAFGYTIIARGLFSASHARPGSNKRSAAAAASSGAMIKNIVSLEQLQRVSCLIVPREALISQSEMSVDSVTANELTIASDDPAFIRNSARTLRFGVISTGLYGGRRLVANNQCSENIYTAEEDAIIAAAEKAKLYNVRLERDYPLVDHAPVSQFNRFETSLVYDMTENRMTVVVRGEARELLARCTSVRESGSVVPMTKEKLDELSIVSERIARENFRVVAVAVKPSDYNNLRRIAACQHSLTLEGFMAVREPLLDGAAMNIMHCREAGMRVILTTDDVSVNNVILARTLGIIDSDEGSITGEEASSMKEGLFRANIPLYNLYQGLDYQQKHKLISSLRADGEVVGILGRSLGETPLLDESDVGYAPGVPIRAGVNVTRKTPVFNKNSALRGVNCEALKSVSDVVVSEADTTGRGGFNAMLDAVKISKVIYQNLSRMVKYLMASQTARLLIVLYGVISGNFLLTPVQILFGGLVMDFSAVILIAFEGPTRGVLRIGENIEEKLRSPLASNIDALICGAAWALLTLLASLVMSSVAVLPEQTVSGVFFSMLLSSVAVRAEISRKESIFTSVRLHRINAISAAALVLFIAVSFILPPFGLLFDICRFPGALLAASVAVPVLLVAAWEIYKAVMRRREKQNDKKAREKAEINDIPSASARERRTVDELSRSIDIDGEVKTDAAAQPQTEETRDEQAAAAGIDGGENQENENRDGENISASGTPELPEGSPATQN